MPRPPATRLALPAMVWLLRHVGTDRIVGALQRQADAVGARQQAIRKARMTGGTFGAWIAEGTTRYVVFKDGEPIDSFPPIAADLRDELRHYDRSRLQDPAALRTAVARRRVLGVLGRLRRRSPDGAAAALPGGAGAAFERAVADLQPLLDELTASPPTSRDELPAAPGVYVVSRDGTPLAAGEAADLAAALRDGHPDAAVQCLQIGDPLRRQLFAMYAREVLGTGE